MNKQDREKMDFFGGKLEELSSKTVGLDHKVDRILRVLEDDKNSTSLGLISEVNELKRAVKNLMYINRTVKRMFWWIMSIVSAILIFLIKRLFN